MPPYLRAPHGARLRNLRLSRLEIYEIAISFWRRDDESAGGEGEGDGDGDGDGECEGTMPSSMGGWQWVGAGGTVGEWQWVGGDGAGGDGGDGSERDTESETELDTEPLNPLKGPSKHPLDSLAPINMPAKPNVIPLEDDDGGSGSETESDDELFDPLGFFGVEHAPEESPEESFKHTAPVDCKRVKSEGGATESMDVHDAMVEGVGSGASSAESSVESSAAHRTRWGACPSKSVPNPPWLDRLPGWTTIQVTRISGNSAGTSDKYFIAPVTLLCFYCCCCSRCACVYVCRGSLCSPSCPHF